MSRPAPSFIRLAAEEPFRIFFPLGLTSGCLGVLLWPLFFVHALGVYPAVPHARLMIEGMMACFIFGFLGTAGPRVMSVPHFRGSELARLLVCLSAAVVLHLMRYHALGDLLFLCALLSFFFSLGTRFRAREDSPPPNFALVGLGLLNGVIGAALLVFCEGTNSSPTLYRLGNSLLSVGFALLPLLGVAPFFIRRLLDLPGDDEAKRRQFGQAALAVGVGLTIDLTLVGELYSTNPALSWVRCAVAAFYLFATMPLRGSSALAATLRMSLVTLPAALGLIAILPAYRISALHVLFIGGFSLAIFAVATRVVLGHSGNLHLLRGKGWLIAILIVLLVLAMIARFSADFVPTRDAHLVSAAIVWLIAALLWGALVLPHVARVEEE